MFEMIPVESSNIRSVGFDAELNILYIEFKSGGIYAYKGVLEEVYNDFINSESLGRFFFAHIKGKFECEKVDKEVEE